MYEPSLFRTQLATLTKSVHLFGGTYAIMTTCRISNFLASQLFLLLVFVIYYASVSEWLVQKSHNLEVADRIRDEANFHEFEAFFYFSG